MTLGENIKKFRALSQLTQNELAEKLSVSFQTVSKWENDVNEPDITSLKMMCEVFGCSLDELINADALKEQQGEDPQANVAKALLGNCFECQKEIYSGDQYHQVQRKTSAGLETVYICEECSERHEELNKRKDELENPASGEVVDFKDRVRAFNQKKLLFWSIFAGVLALGITLIACILNFDKVGIGWTIGMPLLIGYAILADVYCIFASSWIGDLFLTVASWSIRFPGIIFSFSLDGLIFLIVLKIIFAVLGFFIGIAVFLLALAITSILSVFCFPFILINNFID